MPDVSTVLRAVAPRANAAFVAASEACLGAVMAEHGFSNIDAQAELIAQTAHECAGYTAFAENLNYSAARLVQVWPRRFSSAAAAQPFAKNPKALAIKIYGDRGGNRPGTEDGWNYRGSGALQHTFRPEFDRVEKRTGLPALSNPDMLRDPKNAVAIWQAAATFFVDRHALEPARQGRTELVTLKVNGGSNGLADRKILKGRALAALKGEKLPAGRTTLEQSDDAKRRAKQTGAMTLVATPASGGTASKGGGLEAGQVVAIALIVVGVGAIIGGLFWRHHQRRQAEVEKMRLEAIDARLAAVA